MSDAQRVEELLIAWRRWKAAQQRKRVAWLFAFCSLCAGAGALLIYGHAL